MRPSLQEHGRGGGGSRASRTRSARSSRCWGLTRGVEPLVRLEEPMANGSLYNLSEPRMSALTRAPRRWPFHKFQHHVETGFDVDTVDLEVLNGPPLLVD